MAKKNRKRNVDVKAAAAHDDTPVAVVERPQPQEIIPATVVTKKSATAAGASYHQLAGKPEKASVVYVFGKTGYGLSWVNRAVKLGIPPEELCEQFKDDPDGLKVRYATATANKKSA
jgi:hypothetical protein